MALPAAATASPSFDARAYRLAHGYLPLRGVATLEAAKAHAAAVVGSHPASATSRELLSTAASIGSNWRGIASSNVSPPDAICELEGMRFDGYRHVDDWVPQRLVTATGPDPLPR